MRKIIAKLFKILRLILVAIFVGLGVIPLFIAMAISTGMNALAAFISSTEMIFRFWAGLDPPE